jgi:bacillithiol biosynthesis cysteine-adding enzyme BshC
MTSTSYNVAAMAERPGAIVDYGAFPDPPSALFRDYLAGAATLAPFYDEARWDLPALAVASQRTAAAAHPRREVADALVRQQEARGASLAASRARLIAEAGSVAIVTGQQAILFCGPLLVLYKALAALRVAAALEQRRGAPVVPVFWVASDDHDFEEVRGVAVLDATGQRRALRYAPRQEPSGQPASAILLDATIAGLGDDLAVTLPPSPHLDALLARVARCYRPGASLSQAFAALLSSLLPELVILDPCDPAFKSLMVPVLRREIAEASPTSRFAARVGAQLSAAGYHQQVPVREGFLNLFVVDEGERRALALQDGRIEVRGTRRRLSIDEALRWLEREPLAWSPGALLRPLAQDLLLPTAGYVGGPAELAYHAQIGPSYAHFGIPRPPLVPRPGATLVEPAQARALETEGLALPDVQGDPEALVARWARDAHPEIADAFARARAAVEGQLHALGAALGGVDATLEAAADAAKGRALHQIVGLQEKATRALKKREQARAERLRRTREALFPGGVPQERELAILGVLARHGDAVLAELRERIDPWARGHQVLYL